MILKLIRYGLLLCLLLLVTAMITFEIRDSLEQRERLDTIEAIIHDYDANIMLLPPYEGLFDLFNYLKTGLGDKVQGIGLRIGESDTSVDAYLSSLGYVYMSKGVLMFLMPSKTQTAFILAHELQHQELEHFSWDHNYENRSFMLKMALEKSADLHAMKLLNKLGFDTCEVSKLFVNMLRITNKYEPVKTHPSYEQRIEYLKCRIKEV